MVSMRLFTLLSFVILILISVSESKLLEEPHAAESFNVSLIQKLGASCSYTVIIITYIFLLFLSPCFRTFNRLNLSKSRRDSLYSSPPINLMPSLALSDKKEEKKMKKKIALETPEQDLKKGKKEAKLKLSDSEEEDSKKKKKSKKKEKKRKATEMDETDEEAKSETSSELVEPEKMKSRKKVKLGVDDVEVDNPNAVSKFRISAPLRQKLKEKGIEALFPIQATTFDMVLDGADLVGRARTGQGKTLAFVLPILESLINGPAKSKRKNGYGRAPSVLVLLPTRELAKQVFADFELYGGAVGLSSCCLYGGDSYQSQEYKLKRGVDIVVGTPGRIKDHIERQNIELSYLQFRVLDEADEMLRMGFVEDVELILGKVEDANKVQTLLFSATLPSWVKNVTLAGFRKGKFSTLVATNVAARGLDINDVQLIIQCEPPRDVEAYIHRSGRTGRAGNTGVAVMLYDSRKSNISKIEKEAGIKFERISAPQPGDIARAVGMEAAEKITQVCDSVVPAFVAAAKELLETSGLSAEELLAKALAKTAGFTEIKKRSLLTSMENHVTLLIQTENISGDGFDTHLLLIINMLPVSNPSGPERLLKKSRTTYTTTERKSSFNSIGNSTVNRSSYIPTSRSHCTWLILSLLSLQIILFFTLRSIPFPHRRSPENFPSPVVAASNEPLSNQIRPESDDSVQCDSGRVFVYDMPKIFNEVILQQCDNLNPWSSRCDALSNDGFGKEATSLRGVIPNDLVPSWFWTDQFVSEVIFHNRILNHRCRTLNPESATAFYIPFYAGLAVGQYLWSNYAAADRDRHCKMMTEWVRDQPYWNRSNGWDHFITMGRITWDFRRSKDEDWGSNCIYIPGMRNITRLLIERNSWDHFDVGVPYPTGFHPRSDSDVVKWQDFVRKRRRDTFFCFAGAPRAEIKNDFRGLLLRHCEDSRGACRTVDCTGGRCSNGSSAILETFLGSDFCLQPRGDSFTRRSIFDCMLAGSIPVFFWRRTAYMQYQWFLPDVPDSYSVFIDRNEVKNGTTSIREVLERYSKDDVRRMRERVIELIPNLVYAKSPNGLESFKDAFDVAIDGVFKRFKEQENWYKWR